MSTRQQIRAQVRAILDQPTEATSNFTDAVLNEFINQSIRFTGPLIEYPRDFVNTQVDENVGAYTLPSDCLIIRTAYFGNPATGNDVRPLRIVSEETLRAIVPSWMDSSSASNGRPNYLIEMDRMTVFIYPKPIAAESTAGKMLTLDYVYVPAALSSDADEPDLPVPYHDLLQFYVAHLCYMKLNDLKNSVPMFQQFTAKIKALEPAVTKETKEGLAFQWGEQYGVESTDNWGIIPT